MTRRETAAKRAMMTAAAPVVRERAKPPAPGWRRVLLHVVGSGLLIATGAISLDLYLTGYRTIPVISRLFLLRVIAASGLGLAALVILSRLAAACGDRFRSRRLAAGLDRAVRVHRGPRHRPHRHWPGGGGRICGPGSQRIALGTARPEAAS
jgi:hypothetical protein